MKPQRWYQKKEKKNDYALVGVQDPMPGFENQAKSKVLVRKTIGRRAWFLLPTAALVVVFSMCNIKTTYAADEGTPVEQVVGKSRYVLLSVDKTVEELRTSYVYERVSMLETHPAYNDPAQEFDLGGNIHWQAVLTPGGEINIGANGLYLFVAGDDDILGNADDVNLSTVCTASSPASCIADYVPDYTDFVGYYKYMDGATPYFKNGTVNALEAEHYISGTGWVSDGSINIAVPFTTTNDWTDNFREVAYSGYTLVEGDEGGVIPTLISWLTSTAEALMLWLVDIMPYVLLCFGAGIAFAIFQTVFEELTYKKK